MRSFVGLAAAYAAFFCSCAIAQGTTALVRPLITRPVDEGRLQTLRGNVHPLATAAYDQGAAPAGLPMERMLLVLNRSAAQQSALESLLAAQQNPASPQFHKWLIPQQFGQQFGAADQDIQTITGWLRSHGFTVAHVANGKNVIEFSGTAGQVEEAFHTSIHKYVINGVSHWANSADPQIPVALSDAVAGVATIHNFVKSPQLIESGQHFQARAGSRPQFTASNGLHALSPSDFFAIYNNLPLYEEPTDGTGVTIAVVGRSNIDVSDIASFRSIFFLPSKNPLIVLNGPNPGDLGGGEEGEAVLDTSWAGAVAPNATVKLVVSKTTNTTDGVDLSEQYIIDNNLGDVMTESFGTCELSLSQGDISFHTTLAEQAASEGITYTVAAGDAGAEGCDSGGETVATGGISVNGLASNPYVVAVGGTEFNENGNDSLYWRSSNGDDGSSALSYIPENVWNESCSVAQCGSGSAGLWAGGGGASVLYTKPSWQTGVAGIPNDGARDIPDVSLTAAGHDPYLLCLRGSCTPDSRGYFELEGYAGTSAATPSFAGIMAHVVEFTGRQGQADNVLYGLAANAQLASCNGSSPAGPAGICIFHDVTIGNNSVPGELGYETSAGLYQASAGYDEATGLGSVNIDNLVYGWNPNSGLGPALLTTSSNSLSFGSEDIGFSSTLSLTLLNTGPGSFQFNDLALTQSAGDFSYTKTCGPRILPGESCQLTVIFTPAAAGIRTGSFSSFGLLTNITLTGTGIATPDESFTSTTLSFGNQKVLRPASPQSVTITNSTLQPFDTGNIAITGPDPEDFTQVNTCPVTLASGANCTVYVALTPLLMGNRSASISVPLVTGGQQTISLTGTGLLTGKFEIVNSFTGKVLDVPSDSTADGVLLQQYALNGTPQQQWRFIPTAGGSYEILNAGSGKVLDVTGGSTQAGALIQQWSYLGGANQQWQLVPVDDVHYKIVNSNSGGVLDVVGGSAANGASIQQYSYVGDAQQLWVLLPVDSYNIGNGLSGYLLDVPGGGSDGTQVEQVDADGAKSQQWQFLPTGGGYYAIMNTGTGKVLDDTDFSTSDGTVMQEWDYLGLNTQQWQLVPLCVSGNGGCLFDGMLSFKIVNRLSGKALDDTGFSTTSGTYIQQWDYLGGSNQQWQIAPVVFYNIVNRMSGDVLDVTGGSTESGTLIQQWSSDGFPQQQWQLVSAGGEVYAIVNNLSGEALDVQGSSTDAGALIQQSAYSGKQSQQWEIISVGSGYYEILNSASGLVLDVIGMSTADGAGIQQYNYLGGENQQWQIVAVSN